MSLGLRFRLCSGLAFVGYTDVAIFFAEILKMCSHNNAMFKNLRPALNLLKYRLIVPSHVSDRKRQKQCFFLIRTNTNSFLFRYIFDNKKKKVKEQSYVHIYVYKIDMCIFH